MSDNFKLSKVLMEHFKGSGSAIEITFGDKVTYIIGKNGRGKTRIGDAIQMALKGKSYFNKKYRPRIISDGQDKTRVEVEFSSKTSGRKIIVSQSLTEKDNGTLRIKSNDDKEITMAEINEMYNSLCIRPFDLVNFDPKRQAKEIGVDTTEYDLRIKKAKENVKPYRAELKAAKIKLDEFDSVPERISEVDVGELYRQKEEINKFNKEQDDLTSLMEDKEQAISDSNNIIADLEQRLTEARLVLAQEKDELAEMEKPKSHKPTEEIEKKIENVKETNKQAKLYSDYLDAQERVKKAESDYNDYYEKVTKAEENKVTYIQSKNVGKNVSFDEEGGLLISAFGQTNAYLNENFFSRGELLKLSIQFTVAKMMRNKQQNKETISFIYVDNAESLDEDNLNYIDEISEKYDIQFLLGYQSNETKKGKNCIMLKEKQIQ